MALTLSAPHFFHLAIDSFPNEILSETFRHYVHLDESPWRLVLVNKKWREIALRTPALWTYIFVNDYSTPRGKRWDCMGTLNYSYGRASECRTVEELRAATERAGALPLQIDAIFGYEDTQTAEATSVLLHEVFSSKITTRIYKLMLDIHHKIESKLSKPPLFASFPRLETLEMGEIPEGWFEKVLNATSDAVLRYLRLPDFGVAMKTGQFLANLPSLDRLVGGSWFSPIQINQNMRLPYLAKLEITCDPLDLYLLSAPRLRILILEIPVTEHRNSSDETSPLAFPLLERIQLHASNTQWLEQISAPMLQSLSIIGLELRSPKDPSFRLLSSHLFPKVTSLWVETSRSCVSDQDVGDTFFISALRAVPNVVSIFISTSSSSHSDPKLRLQLLDALGSTDEDELLCPNLEDLVIEFISPRLSDLAEYELYLLNRIVDAREQSGLKLARFVIEWKIEGKGTTRKRFA